MGSDDRFSIYLFLFTFFNIAKHKKIDVEIDLK